MFYNFAQIIFRTVKDAIRSTSFLEGWHKKINYELRIVISNIFRFIKVLQEEVQDQDDKFDEWCRGEAVLKQRLADRARDKALAATVARYKHMDILVYLKAIANNSPTDIDFGPEFEIPEVQETEAAATPRAAAVAAATAITAAARKSKRQISHTMVTKLLCLECLQLPLNISSVLYQFHRASIVYYREF